MASISTWADAARPKTLAAGIGPVVLGTALAWRADAAHLLAACACLLGALGLQIGANYSNDYYDGIKGTDTPDRLGPTRAVAAGLLTPAAMRRGSYVAFAVAGLAALLLLPRGGWPVAVIWLTGVACAIAYTGGPFPLGYNGLGDITAFAFFGPVAVAGTYFVQAQALTPAVIVIGCGPGLFAIALITVNNLRDIDTDRRAGKRTLAVLLGRTFARVEYTVSLVLAAAIPIALAATGRLPWSACIAAAVLLCLYELRDD